MNSLTDLNNYISSLSFDYTDNRIPTVIFDSDATNQSKVVNEGDTFKISPGLDVVEVVNYSVSLPTFTITISAEAYAAGVRVEWDSLPEHLTLTDSETGIYQISGITSDIDWDTFLDGNILLPTNVPDAYYGNWTYDVDINYVDGTTGNESQSYTVAVSVLDVTFLTTPQESVYDTSTITKIDNYPQLADFLDDDYPSATWTLTTTVSSDISIVEWTSTYTGGGTFTYNGGTKGFSIQGTRAQVNNHLQNLYIESNEYEVSFALYYVLSNNQDGVTDTRTQSIVNENIQYFSNPTADYYYTEDTLSSPILGTPLVTDNIYTGIGNYTLEIYPASTDDVYLISTNSTEGSDTWNATTKKLTIIGTKSQINDNLDGNLSIQAAEEVDYLFNLIYKLTTPLGNVSIKLQQMINGGNDIEMSNLTVTRSYVSNSSNAIFSTNTPQITDFDTTGSDSYTLFLDCSFGDWTENNSTLITNPYSKSGTRSEINSIMSSIKLLPDANVSSNGTITATLQKNGNTIKTQTFAINGSVGTYTPSVSSVTFYSTSTWTPSLLDGLYAKISEIKILGGGGGGAHLGGGGGGGGVYVNDSFNYNLSNTTYNITVGTGGAGGYYTGITPFIPIASENGTSSVAFGVTVAGGEGGTTSGTWGTVGDPVTFDGDGGSCPGGFINGTTYSVRTGGTGQVVSGTYRKGGGGGGIGSNGYNSTAVSNNTSGGGTGGHPSDASISPNAFFIVLSGGSAAYACGGGGGYPGASGDGDPADSYNSAGDAGEDGVDGAGGGGGSGGRGGDGQVRIDLAQR